MIKVIYLSAVPQFLPLIANWIHHEFWSPDVPVQVLLALLQNHLAGPQIPLTLVAMADEQPVGTVSLIENDVKEKPDLRPWLAALYVLPEYRQQGVGSQLVSAVCAAAQRLGERTLYLSAVEEVNFYARRGWQVIETNVGPHHLSIMQISLV
ncbi:MAG TPA: GNAT family N-acetyltransferase [Phototrophicaceae bacterium]|nr:GNAT family N-acetyltransferase [Phototrophicaceae bacterium]